MGEYRPGIDPDRRKGPDLLAKTFRWFAVISWFFMITALLIFGAAIPEFETFMERNFNFESFNTQNQRLSDYLFYIMVSWLCLSIGGFIIEKKRRRRKNDDHSISLILLGSLSIFGIIIYFVLF